MTCRTRALIGVASAPFFSILLIAAVIAAALGRDAERRKEANEARIGELEAKIATSAGAVALDRDTACALAEIHARRNGFDGHRGHALENFACSGSIVSPRSAPMLEAFSFRFTRDEAYLVNVCFARSATWRVSELRTDTCPRPVEEVRRDLAECRPGSTVALCTHSLGATTPFMRDGYAIYRSHGIELAIGEASTIRVLFVHFSAWDGASFHGSVDGVSSSSTESDVLALAGAPVHLGDSIVGAGRNEGRRDRTLFYVTSPLYPNDRHFTFYDNKLAFVAIKEATTAWPTPGLLVMPSPPPPTPPRTHRHDPLGMHDIF